MLGPSRALNTVQNIYRKMKKIIKVGKHHIQDAEEMFEELTKVSLPDHLMYCFGRWLNLYFEPWAPNRDTWMDADKYAHTTEELLKEFIEEYKIKL